MTSEPRAMKEIHDIRLKIHEETKDMTMEQRIERTRKSVEEFESKYGKLRRPSDTQIRNAM